MIKVAPSILSADFTKIYEAIKLLENAKADYVHCDVMDGQFVPNITFGQNMVRDLRKHTDLVLDVHLMVQNPERCVESFIEAGADIITIHEEAAIHLDRTLQLIRGAGKKCGVALNPHTPLCMIENVLDQLDMVLLMSVNPGYGGQSLIPYVLKKSRQLKSMIAERGLSVDIEMDGGIYAHNVKDVTDAGVNVIVAGNAVFSADDPADMIARLKLQK